MTTQDKAYTEPILLTQMQVAKLLATGRVSIWKAQQADPTFPRAVDFGAGIGRKYLRSEILEWVARRAQAGRDRS